MAETDLLRVTKIAKGLRPGLLNLAANDETERQCSSVSPQTCLNMEKHSETADCPYRRAAARRKPRKAREYREMPDGHARLGVKPTHPSRRHKNIYRYPRAHQPGITKDFSIDDIYEWISARAKEPQPADQLLIYFSGHGMQSGGAPLWLLPRAPQRDWEAINLDTSKARAVWSRFKHVVFIGDCCASVADNAQFDEMKGSSPLENTPEIARIKQRPVDLLRAARPGKAALEVIVDGVAVSPYTVQLVNTLSGIPSTILETQTSAAPEPLVLRVRKLADELRTSVNSFLRANGITPAGPPMDNVESTTEWIALFPSLPLPTAPPAHTPPSPPQNPPPSGGFSLDAISRALKPAGIASVTGKWEAAFEDQLRWNPNKELIDITAVGAARVPEADWSSRIPDGYHFETASGFFINGASVLRAESRPGIECELFSPQEIKTDPEAVELVLVEFEGGTGTVLPAIRGQIGFIQVEKGRIVSIAYEPSGHADVTQHAPERQQFEAKSQRIRSLRDTLQNVVTGGDLSFTDIQPKTILQVIHHIHYGGRVDFSTLLYLAYAAYASKLSKSVLPVLGDYMQRQFSFVPFDLKILLSLARVEHRQDFEFAPPFPLLTLGWSLLKATHEQVPKELSKLAEHYRNGPWTHLDSLGVQICRDYLATLRSGPSSRGGNRPSVVDESAAVSFEEATLWPEPSVLETYDVYPTASVEDEEEQGFMTVE